jgi:hypothetical protein
LTLIDRPFLLAVNGSFVSEPEYHEVQLSGSVKSIVGYNLTTNPAGAGDSPAVFSWDTGGTLAGH